MTVGITDSRIQMAWWGTEDGSFLTLCLGSMMLAGQMSAMLSTCQREGPCLSPTEQGTLGPVTPYFLPAVNLAVKLQYMDNIRWIREAAKHRLVRAWPGGKQGWASGLPSQRWGAGIYEPQDGANIPCETA